jgi:predicted GNAT family N-acyltransferase
MKSDTVFRVEVADWERDQATLRSIREAVFVVEQNVPAELEWDGVDQDCAHVIAYASDLSAVGTGRLLRDGHIGRLAVIAPWRGRGAGSSLLLKLISIAHARGIHSIALNAQTHALAFYERFGFIAEGDDFDEAGIPHRQMLLRKFEG